jgi:hypothetical protein
LTTVARLTPCAVTSSVTLGIWSAEMRQHTARLAEASPHLQITTELVLDRRVFIARGKNGVSPWIVLSSDLGRFEAAIAPIDDGLPPASGHIGSAGSRQDR